MRRTIAIAVLALLAFGASACSLEGEPVTTTSLTVECEQLEEAARSGAPLTESIAIGVGEQLDLRLCSNPSTGFTWEDPTGEGAQTVELVSRADLQTVGAPPGAAAQESFTFRSVAPGTTTLHFVYSQPWDGGIKGAWALDLTVTIE